MNELSVFEDNDFVVLDAMVLINFHGLFAFDKLIEWLGGRIVVEKFVKEEAKYSKAGPIQYNSYLVKNLIILKEIEGNEQESLFFFYLNSEINGKIIHKGEASSLSLAITENFGLISDEEVVRKEFSKKCPKNICLHSWNLVDQAMEKGFIEEQKAEDLKMGFKHV